jgi:putative ABC transport system permease protein
MFFLAWKNLIQNRTQFLLSVGGVALALLLMLSLDALLAGSEEDLVAYIEGSGADIFVAQSGVKNMHMAASAITYRDVRRADHAAGVASASPILYATGVVEAGGADVLSYVIGFDPDEPLGGPLAVVSGTNRIERGEAIIDEAVARNQNINLNDEVQIFGDTFTVVGITKGLTNIINSVTFIHIKDFREQRPGDAVSYALVKLDLGVDPRTVAEAINERNDDVLALPVTEFSSEERQIIKDMSVEVLYIMNMSGLLIGLTVTALTLYINTLRKRQEYGVLKAIGARRRHLLAVVAAQAIFSLLMGFGVAIGLVWLMGLALPIFVPGVGIALTQQGVLQVLVASLLIGVSAALVPAWQLSRLDPVQVFRT